MAPVKNGRVRFVPTAIPGCFVIEPELVADPRGFFARIWAKDEMAAAGLTTSIEQSSISHNARRGTLRGMHYQIAPYAESKSVRCTSGGIYDVVLDLRPGPSFGSWFATELTSANRTTLYIPEGCAHGFLTLEDDSEVVYQMSAAYDEASSRGVRWDDPAFAIGWPTRPQVISERDAGFALWPMEGTSSGTHKHRG